MKRALAVFAIATNLVLADAVVKELAAGLLKGKAAFSVIPGFLSLAYVENRGCAWGMFQGQVWPLAIFGIAALAFLVWKRKSIFCGILDESLLYAGIVGNLIDRCFRGYVIDMFDFHCGTWHFPCFNVADSCITVSVALMLIFSLFKNKKECK